jgi:hypothetical protein
MWKVLAHQWLAHCLCNMQSHHLSLVGGACSCCDIVSLLYGLRSGHSRFWRESKSISSADPSPYSTFISPYHPHSLQRYSEALQLFTMHFSIFTTCSTLAMSLFVSIVTAMPGTPVERDPLELTPRQTAPPIQSAPQQSAGVCTYQHCSGTAIVSHYSLPIPLNLQLMRLNSTIIIMFLSRTVLGQN